MSMVLIHMRCNQNVPAKIDRERKKTISHAQNAISANVNSVVFDTCGMIIDIALSHNTM